MPGPKRRNRKKSGPNITSPITRAVNKSSSALGNGVEEVQAGLSSAQTTALEAKQKASSEVKAGQKEVVSSLDSAKTVVLDAGQEVQDAVEVVRDEAQKRAEQLAMKNEELQKKLSALEEEKNKRGKQAEELTEHVKEKFQETREQAKEVLAEAKEQSATAESKGLDVIKSLPIMGALENFRNAIPQEAKDLANKAFSTRTKAYGKLLLKGVAGIVGGALFVSGGGGLAVFTGGVSLAATIGGAAAIAYGAVNFGAGIGLIAKDFVAARNLRRLQEENRLLVELRNLKNKQKGLEGKLLPKQTFDKSKEDLPIVSESMDLQTIMAKQLERDIINEKNKEDIPNYHSLTELKQILLQEKRKPEVLKLLESELKIRDMNYEERKAFFEEKLKPQQEVQKKGFMERFKPVINFFKDLRSAVTENSRFNHPDRIQIAIPDEEWNADLPPQYVRLDQIQHSRSLRESALEKASDLVKEHLKVEVKDISVEGFAETLGKMAIEKVKDEVGKVVKDNLGIDIKDIKNLDQAGEAIKAVAVGEAKKQAAELLGDDFSKVQNLGDLAKVCKASALKEAQNEGLIPAGVKVSDISNPTALANAFKDAAEQKIKKELEEEFGINTNGLTTTAIAKAFTNDALEKIKGRAGIDIKDLDPHTIQEAAKQAALKKFGIEVVDFNDISIGKALEKKAEELKESYDKINEEYNKQRKALEEKVGRIKSEVEVEVQANKAEYEKRKAEFAEKIKKVPEQAQQAQQNFEKKAKDQADAFSRQAQVDLLKGAGEATKAKELIQNALVFQEAREVGAKARSSIVHDSAQTAHGTNKEQKKPETAILRP